LSGITKKYIDEKGRLVMTRLGRMSDGDDRSFDIEFWQSLTDDQRMAATWELVEDAHTIKGGNLDELRLQRSVTSLKRGRG
jgi:hypothetical protein